MFEYVDLMVAQLKRIHFSSSFLFCFTNNLSLIKLNFLVKYFTCQIDNKHICKHIHVSGFTTF